ncbi:hypothetical protein TNCV_2664091 [Trichonephila clavipes]|nr:hypothetical protein TNCV_2664091 [Trichonephila clavipes]
MEKMEHYIPVPKFGEVQSKSHRCKHFTTQKELKCGMTTLYNLSDSHYTGCLGLNYPKVMAHYYGVSELVNINVALFSYTRAFSDGPCNFEPWSSDELAPPSPNCHTTPTGGRFSSRQI